MAAKKKSEGRLEKICNKLEKVPLIKWHGRESREYYFYTVLEDFEFRIYGNIDKNCKATDISISVYDASERLVESYKDVPKQIHNIFEKLAEEEKEGIYEVVHRTFNTWLKKRQAVKK